MVTRRGRGKKLCARGAWWALLGGPSTSPLESATETHLESHEELGIEAEDPSFNAAGVRARTLPGIKRALWGLYLPALRVRLMPCLRSVPGKMRAHSRLVWASSNNRWRGP